MSISEARRDTYYLPAERRTEAEVAEAAKRIASSRAALFYDDYPLCTLILDDSRQIVYANGAALSLFGASPGQVLGQRPGEALGCSRCAEAPNGCGTGSFCLYCGAARALEASLAGESFSEQCFVSRDREGGRGDPIELMVWTSPLRVEGSAFVIFAARDISGQKRREVLERVFYHDIANTATGIGGLVELLREDPGEEGEQRLELLHAASRQLAEEIESHRALKEAEEGTLAVSPRSVASVDCLERALGGFSYYFFNHEVAASIEPGSERFLLRTDPVLLGRVLGNMIKNALEAANRGETVYLRSSRSGEEALFSVRNRAVMGEEARRRVFQRSFSTKGPGRGVGTYGMRLLGERYLGGKVEFSSAEGEGTVFTLRLPLEAP